MRSLIGAGRPVCFHRLAVFCGDGVEWLRAAYRAICAEFDREAAVLSGLNFCEIAVVFPRVRGLWQLWRKVRGAFCGKGIGPRDEGSGGRFCYVEARGLGSAYILPGPEEPCSVRCGLHRGAGERHGGVNVFAMKAA